MIRYFVESILLLLALFFVYKQLLLIWKDPEALKACKQYHFTDDIIYTYYDIAEYSKALKMPHNRSKSI